MNTATLRALHNSRMLHRTLLRIYTHLLLDIRTIHNASERDAKQASARVVVVGKSGALQVAAQLLQLHHRDTHSPANSKTGEEGKKGDVEWIDRKSVV